MRPHWLNRAFDLSIGFVIAGGTIAVIAHAVRCVAG
jgi:hypothetical protein